MAGGYSAPGVYRREIDISDILSVTGVSNGGTVVRAKKGPVRRPVLVTNNKEYIDTFGAPYYVSGLDDKNPFEAAIGGSLVPELGYGAYGALEFLKESDTLYVVRAYDTDDKYSVIEVGSNAEIYTGAATSADGISVSTSPLDVFDTGERISTYDEYYQNGNVEGKLLAGFVGPGLEGDSYAVTIETISPEADWLYNFDEYPTETSATTAQYGYDVAPIWITSANGYETTSNNVIIPVIGAASSACTYAFIPQNAADYTSGDATWSTYSAKGGSDYQAIVPPVDPNVNWLTSTVNADTGEWIVTGTYTSPTDGTCAGTLSATGSYTSAVISPKGSTTEVAKHYPIASKIAKVSVYKRPDDKTWEELYANISDETSKKLRDEPIEVFYGSMTPQLDADGNELFIEKAINGKSKYIYVKADGTFSINASWDFLAGGFIDTALDVPNGTDNTGYFVYNNERFAKLTGGGTDYAPGLFGRDSEFWKYFENRDELPVQILINPSFSKEDKLAVSELCNVRRDCIAANQVGNVKTLDYKDVIKAETYGYPNPSFMALYAGYSRVYDKHNDKYVYLPNSLFGASLYARVDRLTDPWYAPAGTTRGVLPVLDENKLYSQTQIGKLYDKNINSVQYVQGAGLTMMGQKTAQLKKSALDRIQVRRNLIYIQTNIENALKQFLFENNTQQTRLRVYSMIDDFLGGIKAADGLYDYDVVVDESNNTSTVIDSNQLNVDIYVQPVKSIEFIQFTTVVTRTGVSFSDIKLKYV